QSFKIEPGKLLDARAAEEIVTVFKAHAQATTSYTRRHVQEVRSRLFRILRSAASTTRRNEERVRRHCLVQLAHVIEADFRTRHLFQSRRNFLIISQVAQYSVAQTVTRNSLELFLHLAQRRTFVLLNFHFERKNRSEPTDSAAQIDLVQHRFAAVSLEVDDERTFARPARERLPERHKQRRHRLILVILCRVLQESLRLGLRKTDGDS